MFLFLTVSPVLKLDITEETGEKVEAHSPGSSMGGIMAAS